MGMDKNPVEESNNTKEATVQAEVLKAPTSLEEIDTKDFPYIWRYHNMIDNRTQYTQQQSVSRDKALKVLNHPLCRSLEPMLKNEKDRNLLKDKSLALALNEPTDRAGKLDLETQKHNDAVMALYNCAVIREFYNTFLNNKEVVDNFLAGKEESINEQKN